MAKKTQLSEGNIVPDWQTHAAKLSSAIPYEIDQGECPIDCSNTMEDHHVYSSNSVAFSNHIERTSLCKASDYSDDAHHSHDQDGMHHNHDQDGAHHNPTSASESEDDEGEDDEGEDEEGEDDEGENDEDYEGSEGNESEGDYPGGTNGAHTDDAHITSTTRMIFAQGPSALSQGKEMIEQLRPVTTPNGTNTVTPTDDDVLCKRGGSANNHPGNQRYLAHRNTLQESYLNARKQEKKNISQQLVNAVHQWHGRFLKYDDNLKGWIELGNVKARTKAAQALSEKTDKQSRQIKRQKYKKPAAKRGRPGK